MIGARLRPLGYLLVMMATVACGPHIPLDVSVRAVPADILLGLQLQPAVRQPLQLPTVQPGPEAPLPDLTQPGTTVLPSPGPTPRPTPAPTSCPAAGPFAVPSTPAPDAVGAPPQSGAYPFRQAGTYQPDSTQSKSVDFPDLTYRSVANVSAPDAVGTFTYDVIDSSGGRDGNQSVTENFRTIPNNPTSGGLLGLSATQAAGIFLTGITWTSSDGSSRVFQPASPITFINFPASNGVSWDTAGSDAQHQSTMQLHGVIEASPDAPGGRHRVDACGTLVDSWEVHATGSYVTTDQNIAIDWRYDVATQLGGITVREVRRWIGPDSGLRGPSALSIVEQVIDRIRPGRLE